jgi:hypothetical protein
MNAEQRAEELAKFAKDLGIPCRPVAHTQYMVLCPKCKALTPVMIQPDDQCPDCWMKKILLDNIVIKGRT